ncbi:DUF6371 domain-containing protein [Maribacter sp. Hel_I_7]|uniref:DUF6371 domain-containing protein n=1 Tax=Maribacter sp. Hel_I_7 TaxID=1249997 RepID=UPI00047B5039|nr:DUF6371 domain-containing protein [Maribacter sp. Hel_I_7]
MKDYKYILEPYKSSKSRYHCPSCNKANQFTRYVNIEVSEYVNDNVGICNRLEKCGYHLTPKEYLQRFDRFGQTPNLSVQNVKPITPLLNRYNKQLPTTNLDREILSESFKRTGENNFLKYMVSLFGREQMEQLKKEYLIGTSERDNNRVDFFQVDLNNNVRQLKNMGYDPLTGKKQNVYFTFPKSKYPNYNLVQCFFGEHLLKRYPDKKVAIVESEKTAIIASVYINEFVWLAAGNANGLNHEKTKVLKGRNVTLYPDLGQYENWLNKISDLEPGAKYEVSKILEIKATEEQRLNGYDLADFLINIPLEKFRKQEQPSIIKYDPTFDESEFEQISVVAEKSEFDKQLISITEYFSKLDLKGLAAVEISKGVVWSEPDKTIKSYLNILNSGVNEKVIRPYYDDLKTYQDILNN